MIISKTKSRLLTCTIWIKLNYDSIVIAPDLDYAITQLENCVLLSVLNIYFILKVSN